MMTPNLAGADPRAFLAAIVLSSDDAIISKDVNGIVTTWNDAAERIFGYKAEEMLGQPVRLLALEGREDEMPAILARVSRGEKVDHFETVRRHKNGGAVHISLTVSPILDDKGVVIGASKIARDITARRNAADALKVVQDRLAAIVLSSHDAIVGNDVDGIVTSWNNGAERIFGYKAEEMLGQPARILAFADRKEEMATTQARVLSGEQIDPFETVRRHKDGGPVHISLTVSPIHDSEGRIVGVSKVARDISPARKAAEALRIAQEQLRVQVLHAARLAEIGQIAANLVHEISQPIGALTNYLQAAQLLLSSGAPEKRAKVEHAVVSAARQAERAGEILRKLRDFTRPHAQKPAPVSMSEIVAESLLLATLDRTSRGILLEIEAARDGDRVMVDRVEIQQVLLNLIRNAVEATEGRSLRLVKLSTTVGDGMVAVSVEDSGCGLAPEVRETLFQPFHTTKENGMGVGLAICRSIVEAHGGEIGAKDRAAGGTVFRFTLPAARTI